MYVKLKTVGGCVIGINPTFILVIIIIAWYISAFFIPVEFKNLNVIDRLIIISAGIFLFIVSIILHEMAHFVVASKVGFRPTRMIFSVTEGILLLDLFRMNDRENIGSHYMLKIAIAGPIMSLLMALLFATSWWLESYDTSTISFAQKSSIQIMFYYAAMGNAIFGLINLIPAFPLDGSAIWTALLERRTDKEVHKKHSCSLRIMRIGGVALVFSCLGVASYLLLTGAYLSGIGLSLAVLILGSDIKT